MREALKEAIKAFHEGEVPVGAVVIHEDRVIGRGHNQVERLKDPTAHAEIIAITAAANTLGDWRLDGCEIYVTKEPCPMCAGAIMLSRIKKCVFGIKDEKMGALLSRYSIKREDLEIYYGVLADDCLNLLQEFFRRLRV